MLRAFTHLMVGWLLIATSGGLAEVLGLTIVLPATSAVVIAHAAFTGERALVPGLAVAVALGYVEDLHQGAPVGLLSLAFALTWLMLHWTAGRIAVRSWTMRALVSVLAVVLVDALTVIILLLLADTFAIRTDSLLPMLAAARWHAVATLLVAPPVWALLQRLFTLFRLEGSPRSELHLDAR
jgi:cell shape-determining protein MreD